jgi:uncharacterized protein (DUF3820 family)
MDNSNINTIKTQKSDRKKVIITRTTDGVTQKKVYKGVTLSNLPNEYTEWFNYKGLTFVIA